MEQHITTSNNTPAKKQWQKPELYILDNDSVKAGKTKSSHAENTNVGGAHGASYFS